MAQAGRQGSPRNGGTPNRGNNSNNSYGGGGRGGAARGGAKGAPKASQHKRGERPFAKGSGAAPFANERFGRNLGPVRKDAAPRKSPAPLPKHEPRTRAEMAEDGIRLQKVMANAGVASRRVCEEFIAEGRVEVNGEVVTELGTRVNPETDVIHVDGVRVQTNEHLVYMAFNKPRGVVSTMDDPEGRPCVSDYLRPGTPERLFHVGRLDTNTEGLLLLTNDGELANRLTHPSYEIPKTYVVQVRGPMPQGIGAQLRHGVELEDGIARVDSFRLVDSTPGFVLVEVVLHSGKNRIVRRMFDAVGFPVQRLVRAKIGPIGLGDQKQGTVRRLGKQEIGHLMAAVGL
ncbi:pseudouridine synthase [Sinomonas sp. ASV486]|uniref:pseudouridine synthase n=1 Tax=Sinomonas sp. ASV486 TaxID=3051170 RepID=UPI0027DB3C30|nr:pseudouridine synthase [Sinomonas sp. ASV486]MDQ4489827.1 pseudouridine synthase [Sinomonas sp. ASV486]